jgi:glycosyltransferase involved in cell wall biosynthesis
VISVLILTFNEEQDLPVCLESVAWCDDVHVFDSGSTDATRQIAEAHGAQVTTHRFSGYASQRNAALHLPFRHSWVLVLDADERPTPELSAELPRAIAAAPAATAAFRLRRRDFLWETWLKHAQMSPFYVRLIRVGHARYTREINEVVEIDGDVGDLTAPLDHFPFSKGITHWVAKHNAYSTREAELTVTGEAVADASLRQALFGPDFHARRRAQKALFYRLPARPFLKAVYMLLIRGAIFDGRAGIMYTCLQSFYEYLIVTKTRELRRKQNGQAL